MYKLLTNKKFINEEYKNYTNFCIILIYLIILYIRFFKFNHFLFFNIKIHEIIYFYQKYLKLTILIFEFI